MITRRLPLDAASALRITVKAAFPDETRKTSLAENLAFSSCIKRMRCLVPPHRLPIARMRSRKEIGAAVGERVLCGIMANTSQYAGRSDWSQVREGVAKRKWLP